MQFLEQSADVALVVADTELLMDDLGDAGAGPDLAAEAVSLRPVPEELRDEPFLLGGQPTVAARGGWERRASGRLVGSGQPMADGWLRDAKASAMSR